MTIYQLINDKGNPARNQFVVVKDGKTYFQSYKTMIAEVNNDKVTLSKDWVYSNTTLKHLYIFLRHEGFQIEKKNDVLKAIKNGNFEVVDEIKIS